MTGFKTSSNRNIYFLGYLKALSTLIGTAGGMDVPPSSSASDFHVDAGSTAAALPTRAPKLQGRLRKWGFSPTFLPKLRLPVADVFSTVSLALRLMFVPDGRSNWLQ